MRLRRTTIFFLLISGSAGAFANPGELPHGSGAGGRAVFLQGLPPDGVSRSGTQIQPEAAQQRRAHSFAFPEVNAYNVQSDTPAVQADSGRRAGRLTAEERRALRRQIDEAGHDIYVPKR